VRRIVELIDEETKAQRPGRDLILERLVEVLLVEALPIPVSVCGDRRAGIVGRSFRRRPGPLASWNSR
jgi:cupin